MIVRALWRAAGLVALHVFFLGSASVAAAASLDVIPTRIDIPAGARSAIVTIHNRGEDEISMQADAMDWRQDEDAVDVYEDTTELLVVPRIFSIPPGEKQVIRVGLPIPWSGAAERPFRVFFTELAPSGLEQNQTGIQMRLRLGVPVFAAPAGASSPSLELMDAGRSGEDFEVVLRNNGNTHLVVGDIGAVPASGSGPDFVPAEWAGYLLPGIARRIVIPVASGDRVAAIRARTDLAGPVEYVLPQQN